MTELGFEPGLLPPRPLFCLGNSISLILLGLFSNLHFLEEEISSDLRYFFNLEKLISIIHFFLFLRIPLLHKVVIRGLKDNLNLIK